MAAAGYLLGSISFAIILTRVFAHEDVRSHGSGNAGATNVLRVAGKKSLRADLSLRLFEVRAERCDRLLRAAFHLLGERHRPGAGASGHVCGGLLLHHRAYVSALLRLSRRQGRRDGGGDDPSSGLARVPDLLRLFRAGFAWKKTVSLASICGCLLYPIVTFFITFFIDYKIGGLPGFYVAMATAVAALIGATVIVKHRANIKRILAGEEKPISFKKSRKLSPFLLKTE